MSHSGDPQVPSSKVEALYGKLEEYQKLQIAVEQLRSRKADAETIQELLHDQNEVKEAIVALLQDEETEKYALEQMGFEGERKPVNAMAELQKHLNSPPLLNEILQRKYLGTSDRDRSHH